MQPALVVELLNTDIEDFTTHANWAVKHFATWYGLDEPIGNTYIKWTEQETQPGLFSVVGIARFLKLKIVIDHAAPSPLVRSWRGHLSDIANPQGRRFANMFFLNAVRYRRDRIQVIYTNEGDERFNGVENFSGWLGFNWGDAVQPVKEVDPTTLLKHLAYLPQNNRPVTYGDKRSRSTLVHYLIEKHQMVIAAACDLVTNISESTYRNHRDDGLLLSASEFEREQGESLEAAAKRIRGQ